MRNRRRWIVVLSVITVVALGYLLFFSSMMSVRSIEVSGIKRVAKDDVLRLADVGKQQPILGFDTAAAEERIATLPQIASVQVGRSLPSTLTIEITERTPLAYFRSNDGLRLVDRSGVPFHRITKADDTGAKLPELRVRKVAENDAATRAAMRVLAEIPQQLRDKVTVVSAQTPGSIELTLKGDKHKVVEWGDAAQIDRKAQVLAALLSQPGEVYDVSSPELATIR